MDYVIEGARAILPDDVAEIALTVSDGRIAALEAGAGKRIDGRDLVLAPAMVDIHGDAFERQMMPRPKVFFPLDAAIMETDRQLAANGVATAYHALTLSWEPGLRSVARAEAFIDGLASLEQRLTVENRIQLRWETFAFEALELIRRALDLPRTPSLAFNDHTTMTMREFDIAATERPFSLSPSQTVDLADPRMRNRCERDALRAGVTTDEYLALLGAAWARRDDVPGKIAEVAALGRQAGAAMLSHDDSQVETRRHFAALGAGIAEFPMSEAAARDAVARGEPVVLGAPNVLRGGSHIKSLNAADMVEEGVCGILASDYYYPSMLAAVAKLARDRRAPLPALWRLVSKTPAWASGLRDRGEIAVGQRADLVLIDWPADGAPAVVATFSAGAPAYMARDLSPA